MWNLGVDRLGNEDQAEVAGLELFQSALYTLAGHMGSIISGSMATAVFRDPALIRMSTVHGLESRVRGVERA